LIKTPSLRIGAAALLLTLAVVSPAQAVAGQHHKHHHAPVAPKPESFTRPFVGPAQSIGGAANGCLSGGEALPLSGPGWETLRPLRNRYWGNPALLGFIKDLAGRTAPLGSLLIADMAQPRGGRMPSGHGSHQTGVDVDILYRLAETPPTPQERAAPVMDSVVRPDMSLNPKLWDHRQEALVKTFASDPRVERIFVNPAIKRALCRSIQGERGWLRKLRPWWGHDEHFHIRTNCPAGSPECIPGPPLPEGDGCGNELQSWIDNGAWAVVPTGGVRALKVVPTSCGAVFRNAPVEKGN